MDEITTIFGSLSRLLAIVGGGISTVAVCYAGILWMTSSGDPQNMSKARMALLGAVGGLIIVGVAFLVPRIIGETVVEPVGGSVGGTESEQDCDDVLRNQFVFQRNASTTRALNALISSIQNQRSAECSVDVWSPVVIDAVDTAENRSCVGVDNPYDACGGSGIESISQVGCHANDAVGGEDVPSGLHKDVDVDVDVRFNSGRDRDNNIIIHWSDVASLKPTDDRRCWLYVARLATWSAE